MNAYYNEIESYPAQWLRNLVTAQLIAPGYVDERDIKNVQPGDLAGYKQCHFFAGIGLWSHALRLAGWPDDREVWTGSCPCQPFSTAGKRGGTDDPRHLWPVWFRLIRECKPPVIFGEQVASKDGLAWLDLVYNDLEGAGYAVAALDLCAAGAQAPHLRQRIYFVAHAGSIQGGLPISERGSRTKDIETGGSSEAGELAQSDIQRWGGGSNGHHKGTEGKIIPEIETERSKPSGGMADTQNTNGRRTGRTQNAGGREAEARGSSYWSDIEWLWCRDGYYRPTKPGIFPLAARYPGRVAKLRAIGNAIVPPLAAEFIKAYMELEQ